MTNLDQHTPTPVVAETGEVRADASETTTSTAEWRKAVAASEAIPYEALYPTDAWQRDTQQAADSILSGEWRDMHFDPLDLRPPVAWDILSSDDRIREFRLHSWHALGPVLAAHEHTGGVPYLDFALALALDWITNHDTGRLTSAFAWYPMAAGARAYRLAYVVDRAIRGDRIADEALCTLVRSLARHIAELGDDANFPAHSNQGVFVAASQCSLARRFQAIAGMEAVSRQANERLLALLDAQFTMEGVHREHSPEYHLRALRTFEALVQAGLLTEESALARCELAADALSWFVLPNGYLATFGDTSCMDATGVRPTNTHALIASPAPGQDAAQHQPALREFRDSGYVIVRGLAAAGDDDTSTASYLAQTCAFHSRVHKHADDLSIIWFDRGHELLIDPGKYGYFGQTEGDSELAREGFWYSDPNRIYVESTRAHNTVEIDGRSYPRREVEPYGSALNRVGILDGVAYAESVLDQFSSIQHVRVLVFRPGSWLLIFDWLSDRNNRPHRFTQHLHFAPELALLPTDTGPRFAVPGSDSPLHLVSLLPAPPFKVVSGQRTPEMLGWVSRREREIAPCWTAATSLANVSRASFATLLAFSDDAIVTSNAGWTSSKANVDGRKALLRWAQGERINTVQIDRSGADVLKVNHRAVIAKG